ncbi:Bystin [Cardamine amara subsp. amara]|uniref:Bystin n=1 Tax=Cardamine amara subsp. amara TaxID=228776 RepID=A0ABD1C774_CARAN
MATKRRSQAIPFAASSIKACKTRKLTTKILKEAYAQQREVENEENDVTIPMSTFFKEAMYGIGDFIDADEQSEEFQSELDYQDHMTSENEVELLDALIHKDGTSIANRILDAITCIKERGDKDDATASVSETSSMSKSQAIDYLQNVGKFMSVYTHGKIPKALNHIITSREDYVILLKLTQPETWSFSAMYKVTCMFASSSKAERFYELFLLPRVREDIRKHKKLHFCLYQSIKKALFRPKEFYLGFLIPLCKSGTCTHTEARIIGSIMQKVSIPGKLSSFALMLLADLKFCGTTSYFIKVILDKKYSLPCGAVDAITAYFLRFHKETSVKLVIWHQTLLSFVQLCKHELRKEDKQSLRSLIDKHSHKHITPEIVRELDNSRNGGENVSDSPSAPTIIYKPIKEDLFDMPEVPMEED